MEILVNPELGKLVFERHQRILDRPINFLPRIETEMVFGFYVGKQISCMVKKNEIISMLVEVLAFLEDINEQNVDEKEIPYQKGEWRFK